MSSPSDARRRPTAGRLDPTVRALLRSFLSPAVADTYAAALQPIAVADLDAAIAGAVSALRVRFGVRPEEMAIVLVADTGWPVDRVATMLGLPMAAIRSELEHPDAPRVGPGESAADPLDETESDVVDVMMDRVAVLERRTSEALTASYAQDDVDVEMTTSLPAHVGLTSLDERIRRSDRRQRQVVNGIIVVIIVLIVVTLSATRPDADDQAVELPLGIEDTDPEADAGIEPTPDPSASAAPTGPAQPQVALGPARLAEGRFATSVDPATGQPSEALESADTTTDVRVWVRLDQRPAQPVLLRMVFTAPDATTTVRPVLVPLGISLISVRLPDELGREAGRYVAEVEIDGDTTGTDPLRLEVRLIEPAPEPTASPSPAATPTP